MSGDAATAPSSGTLPEGQERAMSDRIAGVYDAMNSVMTVGMHHRWRERAADLARVGPGDSALDVATGTGDLAIELASRVAPGGHVQCGVPGLQASEVGRALAPPVVHPRRHDRVHRVVDARDAVEHRADLRLGQRPGRRASHGVGPRAHAAI